LGILAKIPFAASIGLPPPMAIRKSVLKEHCIIKLEFQPQGLLFE